MTERHTIDFARVSFNIVSDADRGTITLQFDQAGGGDGSIAGILRAIHQQFGDGIPCRIRRWISGERNPLVVSRRARPHPEYPDVLRFEISVKPGERIEGALAMFLDFLRQQPGYQRTYGSPLDRDHVLSEARQASPHDTSALACSTLREYFRRREQRIEGK
jgi:hypothetical protein